MAGKGRRTTIQGARSTPEPVLPTQLALSCSENVMQLASTAGTERIPPLLLKHTHTTRENIPKEVCVLLTQCMCVLNIILSMNKDYFPKHHYVIGLCTGDAALKISVSHSDELAAWVFRVQYGGSKLLRNVADYKLIWRHILHDYPRCNLSPTVGRTLGKQKQETWNKRGRALQIHWSV